MDKGRTVDKTTYNLFDWMGNSYVFKCGQSGPVTSPIGLDGVTSTGLTNSSQTVVFACGIMAFPTDPKDWHRPKASGNILFADNHVAFYQATTSTKLIW